nr:unnamed protein product [Spirometra erinaceieuropaei]
MSTEICGRKVLTVRQRQLLSQTAATTATTVPTTDVHRRRDPPSSIAAIRIIPSTASVETTTSTVPIPAAQQHAPYDPSTTSLTITILLYKGVD